MAAPDQLLANPYNFRRHNGAQFDVIRGSLSELGWIKTVIVNLTTGHVLDGHARIEEALRQELRSIPVTYVELSEDEEKIALAVLDPSSEMAYRDDEAVKALLQSISTEDAGLRSLFTQMAAESNAAIGSSVQPGVDPNEAPPLPVVPVTQLGDVILLGRHVLICGDATDPAVWDRLLGDLFLEGQRAAMLWTDPPYGVKYIGGTKDALTIANDALSIPDLQKLLLDSLSLAYKYCRPGASWYVAAPHGPQFLAFAQVMSDLKVWRQTLVWVKHTFALGRSDYHYRHEAIFEGVRPEDELSPLHPDAVKVSENTPVLYGWTAGASHSWRGGRKQSTVLEFDKPTANKEHPTMKPVGLVQRCIENNSVLGDIVIDPFAGSGSTLMAAELTGRLSFNVELDPAYCDVIVSRWERATGLAPTRPSHASK